MKKLISLVLCAMLLVCLLAPTAFAAAEVRYTVDGVTKEGTLVEAMQQVSPRGGEIVLLQDISVPRSTREYAIICQSSITLDLNGHTLSGYRPIRLAGKGILSTSLITDTKGGGAIVADHIAISVTEGGLHLKGITVWSKSAQAISYDDFSGDYNVGNLIEDSLVGSGIWGALSFNHTEQDQSKTYFAIRNSTLVNAKGSGYAVVRQKNAVAANLELLENVQLISGTKGDVVVQPGVELHGEALTKQDSAVTVEIAGNSFEGFCWKTPATATVKPIQHPPMPKTYSAWITTEVISESVPAAPAQPAETPAQPAVPAQPSAPAETPTQTPAEAPSQPAAPAQPAQQTGDNTVVIAVVAAAVVVALCAVVVAVAVVLKYTKKMKDE